MSDYLKVIGSAGSNGFYPVPDGSSLSSAQAVLAVDGSPAGKVIAQLPAPPAGKEWRKVTEVTTPTNPTTPTEPTAPGSSSSGAITGTGTAIYQGRPVQYIIVTS
jgi:hypothetical protein